MRASRHHREELFLLFANVQNQKEAKILLEDILTPQELDSIAERWQLIQQLHAGVPQRAIAENLGLSICKITKGSRMLKYGSGGFAYFLQKMKKGNHP